MATIRDIARKCDVSPTTVSLVLNNRAGQVGELTRRAVLQAVREMGYRPRPIRQPFVPDTEQSGTLTIGISTGINANDFATPGYTNAILTGILQAADQRVQNILLLHRRAIHRDEKQSIRTHIDGRCEGIVVIAPLMDSPLIGYLEERGVPYVVVGDQGADDPPATDILSVDVDNIAETQALMRHLVGLGHRRIAFVGGPSFVRSACLRRRSYRQALETAGIAYDPRLDANHSYEGSEPVAYEWTRHIWRTMAKEDRPTAFFCWNDNIAARSLLALSDLGVAIPQSATVIGFDDGPGAFPARLTTMRQPYRAIGEKAVELLTARINREIVPLGPVYLPCDLIRRETDGPPPLLSP